MPYIDSNSHSTLAMALGTGGGSSSATLPVSLSVTPHHFMVLRAPVLAGSSAASLQMLSNLNGELVQQEALRTNVDGYPLALVSDATKDTVWLITSTSIFQVPCRDFCCLYCIPNHMLSFIKYIPKCSFMHGVQKMRHSLNFCIA
jgi:hypothetical protein